MSGDPPAVFAAEGLTSFRWENGPGFRYESHRHDYHKVLVCTEGSITFHLRGGDFEMRPGDRLDLPAATEHAATVGPEGVVCWEAARHG